MTDNPDVYTPIACARYDVFEIAIMHGTQLHLTWHDDHGIQHHKLMRPLNLETVRGEEFLIAAEGATHYRIRIDRISHCRPR